MRYIVFLAMMFLTYPVEAKMQQTTWSPDTCDKCVIVYEWDDTVSQELRTHTPVSVVNEHQDFKSDTMKVKYDKILEENQRKNIAVGEIIKNNPAINGEAIGFSYDAQHKLHLTVPGLTAQEKINAQNSVDTKVGNGKVILE